MGDDSVEEEEGWTTGMIVDDGKEYDNDVDADSIADVGNEAQARNDFSE